MRRTTKVWQFSIAQLLLLTLLVGLVFAAFRWHLGAGLLTGLVCILVPIIVARTRAAIRQQEPGWNELGLPDCIRREQSVPLTFWSCCIVSVAMPLFAFGYMAMFMFALVALRYPLPRSPEPNVTLDLLDLVLLVFSVGSGATAAVAWLWATWPKPPPSSVGAPLGESRPN